MDVSISELFADLLPGMRGAEVFAISMPYFIGIGNKFYKLPKKVYHVYLAHCFLYLGVYTLTGALPI
ncbi:hypothetical protein [Domibacillus robiginosus]|uniref:hypothetical protein n=1 Tax=Domibacillus robiginosus TaxID=1071054 RepID=UPI00067DBD91|nr:hypothetical protein [Domibacillus robiginosus]